MKKTLRRREEENLNPKPAIMAKKPKEKLPPPPSISSSSEDEDSPPPAVTPVKKPSSVSITAVLQKSIAGEEDKNEEGSESEEDFTDDESSEDSGAAAEKVGPVTQPRDSRIADGKEGLNTSFSSSFSSTESEDGEGDGDAMDSGTESEQKAGPSPAQEVATVEGKNAAATQILGSESASEDESESSSDSDRVAVPLRSSPRNAADLSLKPLSSKPMDSPVSISRKRSNPTPAHISKKRRNTAAISGAEGGQEKKEITRRIWSKEDELALLRCVLDYNEHHQETLNPVQVESLLKFVNDSLSSSVTSTQMNKKIFSLKKKYIATIKKVNDVNNPNISNVHDAASFDLSKKIWGPHKKEPVFTENTFKSEKVKEIIKEEKGKANHLAVEYPFLRWHAKNDHADIALVVPSHIPTAEAKELERSCKKLEMVELQLHMQKTKLFSSSLKLIEDALEKL